MVVRLEPELCRSLYNFGYVCSEAAETTEKIVLGFGVSTMALVTMRVLIQVDINRNGVKRNVLAVTICASDNLHHKVVLMEGFEPTNIRLGNEAPSNRGS